MRAFKKTIATNCLFGLFVLVALGNGCSTPPIPDSGPEERDTAFYSYQECLGTLPRGASMNLCNNVGSINQTLNTGGYSQSSYNTGYSNAGYSNSYGQAGSTGPGRFKTTSRTPSAEAVAVEAGNKLVVQEYLKTLDSQTLREMTAQWREIAAQASAQ